MIVRGVLLILAWVLMIGPAQAADRQEHTLQGRGGQWAVDEPPARDAPRELSAEAWQALRKANTDLSVLRLE